jgi:hypothetical protein
MLVEHISYVHRGSSWAFERCNWKKRLLISAGMQMHTPMVDCRQALGWHRHYHNDSIFKYLAITNPDSDNFKQVSSAFL